MRMRVGDDPTPKPMMPIGDRPVLWHIMRYYAHFGHRDFILCLGFGASQIKDYFLNYRETSSNDFVIRRGGERVELLRSDISDWSITFVDTGLQTEIGERLRRVRAHLGDDDVFLAHYGDVLTDAPMNSLIEEFLGADVAAQLLAIRPPGSFHVVRFNDAAEGRVLGFQPATELPLWVNGGFFVMRQRIFDYLEPGEDLVSQGFARAAMDGQVRAVSYEGFWRPMDTLKERAELEALHRTERSPWAVWRRGEGD